VKALTKTLLFTGGLGLGAMLTGRALLRKSRWFSYRGKTVLVTGGSRGLGLVLARQLVEAGARVAICARNEKDLRTAQEDLQKRGGQVLSICCDVREGGQVQTMVNQVREHFGTLDVLINNAGVIQVGPLDAMTEEDFRDAMATHFWGPLNTIRAALPIMRRQRWGRIVNISSIGGKVSVPHLLPYCASKFALVGLSNGLRAELAREGILVTTICPGLMRTGSPRNALFKGQNDKEYAWFSLSDALPVASISADSAARGILRACQNGEAERVLSAPAKLGVWLQHLTPDVVLETLGLVDRVLPEMGGIGRRSAKGYESESSLAPSWLRTLDEKAAVRNNETSARP
jgi:NAD(P)-dependent dehydrogenase (short-subunit alcohol dehydrogenase family)